MTTIDYRYTKKLHRREKDFNKNVREMIEMLKNEKIEEGGIHFDRLTISKHANRRAREYFDCGIKKANENIVKMLKKAVRIGDQLAYDGRINVLYAYNKVAIYLSPNLEHVVTFKRLIDASYQPIYKRAKALKESLNEREYHEALVNMHKKAFDRIEAWEERQTETLLKVEEEVSETINRLVVLLESKGNRKKYKKYLKERISEERLKLKREGYKLFQIKLKKRHIGKSMASII